MIRDTAPGAQSVAPWTRVEDALSRPSYPHPSPSPPSASRDPLAPDENSLPSVARSRRDGGGSSQPARQEAPLSEINWAVELRKIEREFDGLPPEPTPTDLRHKRDAEREEREREDAAAASFGVYFRLTLVLCLAVSLACWPYEVTCGAMLSGYLGAIVMLVVAGIWTATATFTHRMPKRHLTAVLVVLWGLMLGAAQVLPRIGYANPAPGRSTTWRCSSD